MTGVVGTAAGTVAALVRYPVVAMLGETLASCHVTGGGLLGDHAFAVVDVDEDTVADPADPQRWSGLLEFRASYTAEPEPGAPLPPVDITLQDGSTLRSDDEKIHTALSGLLGREVRLTGAAPASYPLHVVTSATLDALAGLAPSASSASFDARRYRPHLLLEVPAAGFVEDEWVGRTVTVGDVGVGVRAPAPCGPLTTLAQDGLPADATTLATVEEHHRREVPGGGARACVGVHGEVDAVGTVSVGDPVTLRA